MLVDGGGFFDETFDVGKYVMAPFLWHERIARVDTVALTHPHPDHLQGLLYILENFHVGEVWTNGQTVDSPLYQSFRDTIRDRGIPHKVLSDFTPESETSGVTIRILNPSGKAGVPPDGGVAVRRGNDNAVEGNLSAPPPRTSGQRSTHPDDLNERSLVIRLTFGRRSFLLSGDISETSERRLSQTAADLRSDVLFVPHHGGIRSSTLPFLEKVRPEVAVVSCGLKNVFRFPHADVIERLERMQSRVFRTDRDGAITIVTDGNDLKTGIFRAPVP